MTQEIFAYPGDTSGSGFPFVADRWMWQTGNQWMAVAAWESEAEWFADIEDVERNEAVPTPRVRAISDIPPTGRLVYRDRAGAEQVIDRD